MILPDDSEMLQVTGGQPSGGHDWIQYNAMLKRLDDELSLSDRDAYIWKLKKAVYRKYDHYCVLLTNYRNRGVICHGGKIVPPDVFIQGLWHLKAEYVHLEQEIRATIYKYFLLKNRYIQIVQYADRLVCEVCTTAIAQSRRNSAVHGEWTTIR